MAMIAGTVAGNNGLAIAIKNSLAAKLEAVFGDDFDASDPSTETSLNALCDGLADAIVTYIQANAEVAFVAGEISGNDSGLDTHGNLTASGGSVS